MKRALGVLCLLAALLAVHVRVARAATDPLADFGGDKGMNQLADDFVQRLITDPRIKDFFRKADVERLTFLLFHQFAQLMGGTQIYKGKTMKETHKTMGIREREFNALVEDLEITMRARKIPFRAQAKLLGKLAAMKRDIVTR